MLCITDALYGDDAEARIYRKKQLNTISVDALASSITRSLVTMVLVLPPASQSLELIENI